MKFIYYSDSLIPLDQVIQDFDLSLVQTITTISTFPEDRTVASILLCALSNEVSEELIQWHNDNLDVKIVLISNTLKETYLRDLQIEHNFYDLFFKFPIKAEELLDKVKMISTFTNTSWNASPLEDLQPVKANDTSTMVLDPLLMTETIDISSLTDGTSNNLIEDHKLVDEVSLPDETLQLEDQSVVNALTLEANNTEEENLDLIPSENEGLSLDNPSDELKNLFESTEVIDEPLIDPQKGDQEIPIAALVEESSLVEEPAMSLESFPEEEVPHQNDELMVNEMDKPLTQVMKQEQSKDLAAVEKVTLNEIIENKDDQIYRLMAKNKILEEEFTEKEEMIKQLQKELREQQLKYQEGQNIFEENNFQIKVLKSSHELEKLEIKNQLESVNAKNKILESRIEELKRSSMLTVKSGDVALSVGELRKLKARQEQLEEKISLLQSDSAIQLQHREKKIVDLKRKVDLLEFDVKDSFEREAELKKRIQIAESKMAQMKHVLKQAMEEPTHTQNNDIVKKTGSYDV